MLPKDSHARLALESLETRWLPSGLLPSGIMDPVSHAPSGLVFVDESLVQQIPADEFASDQVVVINHETAPLDQMDAAIRVAQGIESIRIISHGADGVIRFGDSTLSRFDLESHSDLIKAWADHLSPDADLLVYGCGVASTQSGRDFVDLWSSLTGLDVAASDDLTGASGDLDLEYSTGTISIGIRASQSDWRTHGTTLGLLPNQREGSGSILVVGSGKQFPNWHAFAALKKDGSLVAWGDPLYGAVGVPAGNDFVEIASSTGAFAALRRDGSIAAWGNPEFGGTGAPTGSGFLKIFSSNKAFAALDGNGKVTVWGHRDFGGIGAPIDSGYIDVYSSGNGFAAIKPGGKVTSWGVYNEYANSPKDEGFVTLANTPYGFAGLKSDGTIKSWGGGHGAGANITEPGYVKLVSNGWGYAALHGNGRIVAWGHDNYTNYQAPTGNNYIDIVSNEGAFSALRSDGSIESWGDSYNGGGGEPIDKGFQKIVSARHSFSAVKKDGTVVSWGLYLASSPSGDGYQKVASSFSSYAALRQDGTVLSWGEAMTGGKGAPTIGGFSHVFSTSSAFAALRPDGSVSVWGNPDKGGSNGPSGSDILSIQSVLVSPPYFQPGLPDSTNALNDQPISVDLPARGLDIRYSLKGTLPAGVTLDEVSGRLQGAPTQSGDFNFAVLASNQAGFSEKTFLIRVAGKGVYGIATSGGGQNSNLAIYESGTTRLVRHLVPFPGFKGEFYVDSGDISGDGIDDLIVGSGTGSANGHVVVFDGARLLSPSAGVPVENSYTTGGAMRASLYAFTNYRSGVAVRLGDLNDDGFDDIILAPGTGAGTTTASHLRVWDGRESMKDFESGRPLPYDYRWEMASFYAFGDSSTPGGGLSVSVVRQAGADLVVASQLFRGGSKVFSYNGTTLLTTDMNFSDTRDFSALGNTLVGLNVSGIRYFANSNTSDSSADSVYVRDSAGRNLYAIDRIFGGTLTGLRLGVANIDSDPDKELLVMSSTGSATRVFKLQPSRALLVDTLFPGGTKGWI